MPGATSISFEKKNLSILSIAFAIIVSLSSPFYCLNATRRLLFPMPPSICHDGNIGDEIGSKNQCANDRYSVCLMIMLARFLA